MTLFAHKGKLGVWGEGRGKELRPVFGYLKGERSHWYNRLPPYRWVAVLFWCKGKGGCIKLWLSNWSPRNPNMPTSLEVFASKPLRRLTPGAVARAIFPLRKLPNKCLGC